MPSSASAADPPESHTYAGDDPRVLDGTADEYIKQFLPGDVETTREEGIAAGGKRKADGEASSSKGGAKKVKQEKGGKQTKLDFGKA